MSFELPPLPYVYDALEPYLDKETMEIHHTKHHQAYADKLNAAIKGYNGLENREAEEIIKNLRQVPEEIYQAVRNNGGGYINHNLFWRVMAPATGGEPEGKLKEGINQAFGDFSRFREQFTRAAVTLFGSGWTWLVVDGDDGLLITTTPNQDSPLTEGNTPVLALDGWEHAYYLKYQNRRPDYIEAWWEVVNWKKVGELYQTALAR